MVSYQHWSRIIRLAPQRITFNSKFFSIDARKDPKDRNHQHYRRRGPREVEHQNRRRNHCSY